MGVIRGHLCIKTGRGQGRGTLQRVLRRAQGTGEAGWASEPWPHVEGLPRCHLPPTHTWPGQAPPRPLPHWSPQSCPGQELQVHTAGPHCRPVLPRKLALLLLPGDATCSQAGPAAHRALPSAAPMVILTSPPSAPSGGEETEAEKPHQLPEVTQLVKTRARSLDHCTTSARPLVPKPAWHTAGAAWGSGHPTACTRSEGARNKVRKRRRAPAAGGRDGAGRKPQGGRGTCRAHSW